MDQAIQHFQKALQLSTRGADAVAQALAHRTRCGSVIGWRRVLGWCCRRCSERRGRWSVPRCRGR
jgi:hypothetical protein